jgi:hypothetical protein
MTVKTLATKTVSLENKPKKLAVTSTSAYISFFWHVIPCVLLDTIFSDVSDELSAIIFKIILIIY